MRSPGSRFSRMTRTSVLEKTGEISARWMVSCWVSSGTMR